MDGDRSLYRTSHQCGDLTFYRVVVGETDLHVATATKRYDEARSVLVNVRSTLEAYILSHPEFKESLTPLAPQSDCEVVLRMCAAATPAGVGPMAAVAGAIASLVGEALCPNGEEVIVENGGDLFVQSAHTRYVNVFAGSSPLSRKMSIELPPGRWGVACSAGTFGHSLSFGRADAAAAISHDAALADAAATALGNRLQTPADIESALAWTLGIRGICGALCIIDGAFGAAGEVKLVASS